jgi:electron transfer flavoprotein beta subunit
MLIITLLKGVPARTTKVVTLGGILKREEMDIVLNPHDMKAVEASDFFKRSVGGKVIALSMGPDQKLLPIISPLFDAEVHGIDEIVILSDRRMAGSDTLATSYTVALGIKKIVQLHVDAISSLIEAIKKYGYSEVVRNTASELYHKNLIPNKIYSELKSVRGTLIEEFLSGKISVSDAVSRLEGEKENIKKFIILAGVKTTDGETGSVGPQVAEALSLLINKEIPHATYVEDIKISEDFGRITVERKLGDLLQIMEMDLPSLLTVAEEYRPRAPSAVGQLQVRMNNYSGKVFEPRRWNGDDIGAEPLRLGLAGSPTIVGPGVDLGKPPVQKIIDKTVVFVRSIDKIQHDGKVFGPFDAGDLADNLPEGLLQKLSEEGYVSRFNLDMLIKEITS